MQVRSRIATGGPVAQKVGEVLCGLSASNSSSCSSGRSSSDCRNRCLLDLDLNFQAGTGHLEQSQGYPRSQCCEQCADARLRPDNATRQENDSFTHCAMPGRSETFPACRPRTLLSPLSEGITPRVPEAMLFSCCGCTPAY